MKLKNPTDKDKEVKGEIKTIVKASKGSYGYRRVTMVLKKEQKKLLGGMNKHTISTVF
ncbi:IS3 family transposase [Peptoniphilus lacydonensis]|uniref:IS3 family transposase n=1 Tax=Peptoniphilaceae TaxID=1570339 RepID=UPI00373607DD